MLVQTVPIAAIEVPKKWRPVKKKTVAELVLSLKQDGLLHPIGLRPGIKPGTFKLVYGKHRLEAAKKSGWTEIQANVADLNDAAAQSATDAENLFRNSLTPADRVLSLRSWSERYKAEHPDVAGRGLAGGKAFKAKRAALKNGDEVAVAGPSPQPFAEHASEQTGIAPTTVREHLIAGKNLTDEELGVMAEKDVPLAQIRAIGKLDPEPRTKAIALVAAGLGPHEAIAQATLPANATSEQVGDPTVAARGEEDMDDDEWLETYCGEVLARLKFQADFKKDAILYRRTREMRQKLKGASKKILKQSHVQAVGPFYMRFTGFINTDHPAKWLPCGPCGGSGMSGDKSKCGYCHGHAYSLKTGNR